MNKNSNKNSKESNVHTDKEKLIEAVNYIADIAKQTLGAKGSNAIIETPHGYIVTNDGVSIVRSMRFEDPVYRQALKIIQEVANRADDKSQDGTTTAITLAQSIINKAKDRKGIEVKQELDELIPIVSDLIDKQAIEVTDPLQVATVSAESKEMGKLVSDIYKELGSDCVIEVQNARTFDTRWEQKEGLKFDTGFVSPYFANDGRKVEFENPLVLVTKKKIENVQEVLPILTEMKEKDMDNIVLACRDIEESVVQLLLMNKLQGVFNSVVIKQPYGDEHFAEDIATATGAKMASKEMPQLEFASLGTCEKIIVSKRETRLLGIQDLEDYKKDIEDEERLDKLNTKIGVIYLGASSNADYSYRKLKLEDTIGATKLALKHGVVAGGGVCLRDIAEYVDNDIIKEALKAPYYTIVGETEAKELALGEGYGVDVKTGESVDMLKAGIIDPAEVVKNSFVSALSIAGTVLSSEVILSHDEE